MPRELSSLSATIGSILAAWRAGTSDAATVAANAIPVVKASTHRFKWISLARGRPSGATLTSSLISGTASAMPTAAPEMESARLSIITSRRSCRREEPSAVRTANSRCRSMARAR
jgi:hypothetical protein